MAKRGSRVSESSELDDGPDLSSEWLQQVRENLTHWYERSFRPLPWRLNRDPYRILVSELMLVQTTVTAVVPFFERFVAALPDFESLAGAEPDEVLKLWEGLGYYRRARQLHEAAKVVVEQHGGKMPDSLAEVQELPGVGRYIAGAILSFAFDLPAPILEANTQRVAARWLGWQEELRAPKTQARLWQMAERLVPPVNPGIFNQAFMELGATVCTPRSPLCLVCPVAGQCRARQLGLQDTIPVVAPKAPPKDVEEACGVIRKGDEVLMVRRAPGQLWERFWEFPTINLSGADPAGRRIEPLPSLSEGIARLTGIKAEVGPVAKTIRYAVTTHRVTLHAHLGTFLQGNPSPGPGMTEAAWLSPEDLASKTVGAATRRLIKSLVDQS